MKLSPAQRRALKAAAEGTLMWSRGLGSPSYFYIRRGDRYHSTEAVRLPTAKKLVDVGLIAQPRAQIGSWSSQQVEITDAGRDAVALEETR